MQKWMLNTVFALRKNDEEVSFLNEQIEQNLIIRHCYAQASISAGNSLNLANVHGLWFWDFNKISMSQIRIGSSATAFSCHDRRMAVAL